MVFYHKGLWMRKTLLPFVACDRKAAILRVQIWSVHESDVVGLRSTSITSWTFGVNGGAAGTVGAKRICAVLPMISWPVSNTGQMPRPVVKVSAIGWRHSSESWLKQKPRHF